MVTLPGRVTVATARVLALLELADWGARSEAERLLVTEIRTDLQRLGEKYSAGQRGQDAGNIGRLDDHSAGAQSAGAGDGDGGGQGAEPGSAGGGVG